MGYSFIPTFSIYLSVCLPSVHLFIYLSLCLSIYLFIYVVLKLFSPVPFCALKNN